MIEQFSEEAVKALIASGVKHFVIAPGSRSTPLVRAIVKAGIETTVHYDERGAAFYALGIAKASGKRAAVVVTSGTAVANLMPAVMEADATDTPLVLISADRPPHLRGSGANQTTDQVKLFGDLVRKSIDMPLPSCDVPAGSVAAIIASAMADGPVHLNFPFAKPLTGSDPLRDVWAAPIWTKGEMTLPEEAKRSLTGAERGLILAGAGLTPGQARAIEAFSIKTGWPIIDDLFSGIHGRLRVDELPFEPDLIVHFGGAFISAKWQALRAPKVIHVMAGERRFDPDFRVTQRICVDPITFCREVEVESGASMDFSSNREEPHGEAKVICDILDAVPKEHTLFIGNSTLARFADRYYAGGHARLFGNRGVSGIDGNIATIAGIAKASKFPVTALIGDQTALHDMNSLSLLHESSAAVQLIIINNGGGRIFERLPLAEEESAAVMARYFTAERTFDFRQIAESFGLNYLRDQLQFKHTGVIEYETSHFHSRLSGCTL